MKPGVVDLLALGWIVWGVYRGRKRGLGQELAGALSIGIFLVTGCGVYRWTGRVLGEAGKITGQTAGVVGFLSLVAGTVALVRALRSRLNKWSERRYDASQRRFGGAIFGAVRTFLLVCVALLVLAHWPLHPLTRPVAESSLLGRCLTKWVLPVYERSHGML